jgi:hypothetical protein
MRRTVLLRLGSTIASWLLKTHHCIQESSSFPSAHALTLPTPFTKSLHLQHGADGQWEQDTCIRVRKSHSQYIRMGYILFDPDSVARQRSRMSIHLYTHDRHETVKPTRMTS